jgi:hypothetical protein
MVSSTQKHSVILLLSAIWLTVGCSAGMDGIGTGALKAISKVQPSIGTPGGGNNNNGGTGTNPPSSGPNNAKVFFKSPVAAAGATVGYNISYNNSTGKYVITNQQGGTTATNYDSFLTDVRVDGMQGGLLKNSDIDVKTDIHSETSTTDTAFNPSGLARAQADASGNWYFSSVGDSNYRLSQLQAYYWINKEKETINGYLANAWHPTNKYVSVYSRCYDANGQYSKNAQLGLNAFWSGVQSSLACMSFVGALETAHDATVYLHEMGHANVDYGTNGAITTCSNTSTCGYYTGSCTTANGCAGAINEGQADVHSYFVFDSPILAEFFMNDVQGFRDRNGNLMANKTAAQVFATNGGGEIHTLGGIYGATWWTLRQAVGKDVAAKIFFAHLELLTGNDTFLTAGRAAITANNTLASQGKLTKSFETEIRAAFSQHGLTL